MSVQVRFLLSRPDTNAEFWWSSTDQEILSYCNTIKGLAENFNIQHSYVESEDQLTATSTFTVTDIGQWNEFKNLISQQLPDMVSKRQTYFVNNNHSLTLEWFDESTNKVVLRNPQALQSDALMY